MNSTIYPCLWLKNARESVNFYCSIFENSKIVEENELVIKWEMNNTSFMALNGGTFIPNESLSFVIECETQEEIDHYWTHLISNGGQEQMCGWCKDQYGISWQIVPSILKELMQNSEKRHSVVQAFLKMKKFDIQTLLNI